MKKKKVVVAMSGGVDSSVAAVLLLQQGYEVIGLTMEFFALPPDICDQPNWRSYYSRGAGERAKEVAAKLGIPHYFVDFKAAFEDYVVKDFCQEYFQGRTPNPCIRCNKFLKFDLFWTKAQQLGADFIATGHYARIEYNWRKSLYYLKKAKDKNKDQSYFLYSLTQAQLARILFPVGNYTKKEIRQIDRQFGLASADREESQEVCFIPDQDYVRFLRERNPQAFQPGLIVDENNQQLGNHQGIAGYTIGQRRGLGIAFSHPLYVIALRPGKNEVVVGPEKSLYRRCLIASQVNFIVPPPPKRFKAKARLRYRHQEAEAFIQCLNTTKIRVEFLNPQRAITPGQSVVLYKGNIVLGGGVIDEVF